MTISYIVNSFNWNIRKIEFLIDQKKKKQPKTQNQKKTTHFRIWLWLHLGGYCWDSSEQVSYIVFHSAGSEF